MDGSAGRTASGGPTRSEDAPGVEITTSRRGLARVDLERSEPPDLQGPCRWPDRPAHRISEDGVHDPRPGDAPFAAVTPPQRWTGAVERDPSRPSMLNPFPAHGITGRDRGHYSTADGGLAIRAASFPGAPPYALRTPPEVGDPPASAWHPFPAFDYRGTGREREPLPVAGGGALSARSRRTRRATRRQGNADLWAVLRPPAHGSTGRQTGTTPRDGRGTRLSLRFAQRCRPEVGVPCPACRPAHGSTGRDGNHSTGWRGAPFAALRAAVPTGGRRSLTCAPPCPREYWPRREPLHGLARRAFRCAPRSGADRRVGVPCPARRPAHRSTGWCQSQPDATPPRRATHRQGNADLWSAQAAAGGRQTRTPTAGMVRLSTGTPALSVIRTAAWYTPLALRHLHPPATGRGSSCIRG